jgi:predicted ester cyclase
MFAGCGSRVHPFRMADDDLTAFYRRYNACCNEHRFDDLREFVADDVVINSVDRGLRAYGDVLRVVVRAFPDYRWELRHLLIEAPWIAAHVADTGTHRDTFFDVEATGRSVRVQEFAFYRVDAGRIAEVWGTDFHGDLVAQLR